MRRSSYIRYSTFYILIAFAAVPLTAGAQPAAQQSRPEATAASPVDEAVMEGRLDKLESLAKSTAADSADGATVRGKVALLRGQYQEAETLFRQAAQASPTGEGAFELGLLQIRLGRRAEGNKMLTAIVSAAPSFDRPRDIARAARAARVTGGFRQANAFFRAASARAPEDAFVQTAWGDLFLEKFNRAEALKSYQTAVKSNPSYAPALLGLARSLANDNPPAAMAAAEKALSIDESLEGAHLLIAEQALDDGKRQEARESIGRALDVNPNSMDARSLLAATAWLEGKTDEYQGELKKVLAINPRNGEIYRVIGDHAGRNYRFEEAVALVKQGLALDAESPRIYASLGSHLLRTGDEAGARAALDRAFRDDPFDVVTYNLLSMLDSLEKFEVFTEGDLTVKLSPAEAPVLRHYVMPLAKDALKALSARYGFQPKGPILVEVFPRHDDFAVRTLGLPGMIGALGVCFGHVVVMDSPKARPPGSFNWQSTLWHELAHVVTLQMSGQRLPRWLSEGISVFEEKRARPAWGRESDLAFVKAIEEEKTIPLRDLNSGFSSPETISLAYYEASLFVEHLIERFGEPGLQKLITAYKDANDQDAVLPKALGSDFDGLQDSFDAFVQKRYSALSEALRAPEALPGFSEKASADVARSAAAAHPGSFAVQLTAGEALIAAGDIQAARTALERAATLVPNAVGAGSPRALLAELEEKQGNAPAAMAHLEAMLAQDHTGIEFARKLAELARTANDEKRLRLAAERIIEVDPFDATPHGIHGRLALKAGDVPTAVREFRVAIDTGPVDQAGAHSDLAEAYLAGGQLTEAKRQAMAALEIAPRYERAQELLLSVVDRKE